MGSSTESGAVAELNIGRRRVASFIRRKRRVVILFLVAMLAGGGAWAIDIVVPAQAKATVTIDQCANLGTVCDSAHPEQWQHGNLNENNSRYLEGESVPYRAMMTQLTPGATYGVTIEWDTTQSGKHAIDYLTSFDRSVPNADPCSPEACGPAATLPIPVDPNVADQGVVEVANRLFTAFGATFPTSGSTVANGGNLCADSSCTIPSNPTPHVLSGAYSGNSQTRLTVYFTATTETVVLAWGGHIAERRDWGIGKSAVALPGSPYHMRIIDFGCSDTTNCSAGNQDRSLSSAAVVYAASITIVKEASIEGATSYSFSASPSPLTNFALVDDGGSSNTKTFAGITDFGTFTVSETSGAGFTLDSIDCTVTDPNGGTQTETTTGVEIDLREGEIVTCTFRNLVDGPKSIDLAKSASPATYANSGDVITYTYVITNTGATTLGPTQFMITDDRISLGQPFACGAADSLVPPGAKVTCTALYTITTADIDAQAVTNKAVATGGGVSSPLRSATVTAEVTPPSSTSTSTTSTSTTSTSVPGSTTTVVANVVTTTTPPTSSTTAVTPTTSGAEFQALLQPTTTVPANEDFLVLFPDELPNTGSGFNPVLLIVGLGLLAMGALVGFFNIRSNGSRPKERNS